MKVLIYSESAEAKALRDELREAGHTANLRTAEEQFFDSKRPEACDEVHAWDSFIVHAYDGKAEIHYHGKYADEGEEVEIAEMVEEAEPKKRRGRSKIK